MKQLENDPWNTIIPGTSKAGEIVEGKVTKLTNFGVFVELQNDLEGLLHISEIADQKIANPEDGSARGRPRRGQDPEGRRR